MKTHSSLLILALSLSAPLHAALKLPSVISDHMVLQQKHANPLWGWDTPGTQITVTFAGQTHTATAATDGKWTATLDPISANSQPQTLTITGTTQQIIQDVLIGEVWMCSGQSNMRLSLRETLDGDLAAAAAASRPTLRLMKLPLVGTATPQSDISAVWAPANATAAAGFSAVGYHFGCRLQEILGVPIGLIDNAWGGSNAEAWIRESTLASDPRFQSIMETCAKNDAKPKPTIAPPPNAVSPGWPTGQHRPGNIFNGMVHPLLTYGIKGVIWYQGESNAPRAEEYTQLFPFLIEQWRKEQGQGDFPFYWVQLADFKAEKTTPGESDWAELREAQTLTLKLPNTGQAVILGLGEARDIHPRNKQDVAARLVRWALAKDYGIDVPFRSPTYQSLALLDAKATVTLDCFGSSLKPFDTLEITGFTVCGEDRKWQPATAKLIGGNQVELTSTLVPKPTAVRYAWADNPVCNLFSADGLPVTPFRTDDFERITRPK